MTTPSIMITDGGPHPADKWAVITAGQIIQIAEGSTSTDARKFELKILDTLEAGHKGLQDAERAALAAKGDDRLADGLGGHEACAPVIDQIVAAAAGTSFEAHFARAEVREHIDRVLHQHFDMSVAIERDWHAHRHPDGKHARAWRKRNANGVTRTPKEAAAA
jgi:hypothetical protein